MKKPTDTSAPKDDKTVPEQEPGIVPDTVQKAETQTVADKTSSESVRNQKSQRKVSKPASKTPAAKDTVEKGRRLWPMVLLNLILIVLFLAASYFAWQEWKVFKTTQSEQYTVALQELGEQAAQLEIQLQQSFINEFEKLQAHNDLQDIKLAEQQMEIAENAGRNQLQWTLAETQFLVRMAGRKVWLERDVVTAIALLHSADTVLKEAHAPEFLPIREAISRDVSTLKAEATVDAERIAMKLNALHSDVPNLSFTQPESFYQESEQQASNDLKDWRSNLAILWQGIKDNFISIERVDTPITPFVSSKLQVLKRSELSLQLLLAQQALLQRQQAYFKASVDKALMLLGHFDTETPQAQAMRDELQQMSELAITTSLPQELKTLPVLRRFIDTTAVSADPQQD